MKTLKQRLRAGEVVFGATVSEYLRPSVVKAFVNAGFDFIYIENEHASFDPARLTDFVLCARDNQMTVVAKIPQLERAETARMLEMGIMGFQLPRTETADDMKNLHDYIKFPPIGSRASATGYGNSMYAKVPDKVAWYRQANDETMLLAHLETKSAVDHAASILAVPGIDVAFIGCSDLSLSLGNPGNYTDPSFVKIVERIFDISNRHNLIRGLPATDYDTTKHWIDHGVQFFECVSDLDLIRSGAAKAIEQLHRARGK